MRDEASVRMTFILENVGRWKRDGFGGVHLQG